MILASVLTMVCSDAVAQTIEIIKARNTFENNPQIRVGDKPSAIAVNPQTNKIYVANSGDGTVSVIDGKSGNISRIRVGTSPSYIAIDDLNNRIYVANEGSGTVSVIDGYNDSEILLIRVGQDPSSIVPDMFSGTQAKTIYVLCNGTVSAIDVSSGHVKNIPIGENPSSMAINSDANKIYVVDGSHTVSVIDGNIEKKEPYNILVGKSPGSIAVLENKIYVANRDDGTVSVIGGDSNKTKTIPIGGIPSYLSADNDANRIYVASDKLSGNGTVSAIDGDSNHIMKNITVGKEPIYFMISPDCGFGSTGCTPTPGGLYVLNKNYGGNGTVSVIPRNVDQKEIINIPIGKNPEGMAKAPGVIYVVNPDSNSVSAIDEFSNKVAAGIKFNIYPANSGTVICDKERYPINTYLYVSVSTECIAQPNKYFQFSEWFENLGGNSTIPIGDSSNLTISRYGTFTANFKPLPPVIPPEFLLPLYGIIVSSIVGWSIPSIIGWIKAKRQQGRVHQYHTQINYLYADGGLDENDIGSLDKLKGVITDAYAKGKITDQQYADLKSEISLLYEEIYDKKIGSLSGALGKNDDKSLDIMKNDITDAYAKGKIIESHYNILKEKISKAANDNNKRNKDVQAVKRAPL